MACFLVPTTEAIVTTVVSKTAEKKGVEFKNESGLGFGRKLKWLNNMLWGGSALLALEHLWHGEIQPWFPFLTAMGNAEDTAQMLREISTVGVGMALAVTAVWVGIVVATGLMEKKAAKAADLSK
jgi:hypothetical protein